MSRNAVSARMPAFAPAGDRDEKRTALLAWIAFVAVSLVWGSTYFAIAIAIRSFTTYGLVSVRFAIGAVLCLGLGRVLREPFPDRRDVPHVFITGLILLGICNALVTWAEQTVPSGLTAVLCAPIPLYMALFTIRTEPLPRQGWIGALLGLGGVVVLMAPWQAGHAPFAGAFAVVVANLFWASGTLYGRARIRSGGVVTTAGLQMLAASIAAFLIVPFQGGLLAAPLTRSALLAMLYLAVVGSCVAFTAYSFLTKAWPAARAGTYAYLNPVVAVALGSLFLAEPFGLRMALGMLVILAGVALVQQAKRKA